MRSSSGQATLEYVAVVAVVAAVLGVAVAAGPGRDLAGAVHAALVRGVCVVSAGQCAMDLEPCPTGWRRDGRTWAARVLVVRLGGDSFVVRERRSDGTVAVTFGHEGSGGVELGVGRGAGAVDLEARAAALSAAERASTWVLPDERAADRLLARVERWRAGAGGSEPDVPDPDVTFARVARQGELGAAAVLRPLGAEAAVEAGRVRGLRHDRTTGRTTVYVEHVREVSAGVGAGADVRRRRGGRAGAAARTSGAVRRVEQLAVTVDAGGRPVELQVLTVDPSGEVPGQAAAIAALLPGRAAGRLVVTEQRLDLTDAGNRAAAATALAALARGRGPAPSRALAARLRAAAVVHVRAYAVDRRRDEAGLTVGAGALRVGGARGVVVEDARLVAALTRGIGGDWTRRADCLAA